MTKDSIDQATATIGMKCPKCGYDVCLIWWSESVWAVDCLRDDGKDKGEAIECGYLGPTGATKEDAVAAFLAENPHAPANTPVIAPMQPGN